MKLLLADDHTLFREALIQFLEKEAPDMQVRQARDMREVVEFMETDESPAPDLVLLDLRMPGMRGLQGLENFRQNYPEVPVALLSGLAEKKHVRQAFQLGAAGYFPKTMSGRAMLNGFNRILGGEEFMPIDHNTGELMSSYYGAARPDLTGYSLHDGSEQDHYQNSTDLTKREEEVLSYLLHGASNREIADELGLQVVTIKLHVRGICRKLGARNRTQAALKAQEFGLTGK